MSIDLIKNYVEFYPYYKQTTFKWNKIKQYNKNMSLRSKKMIKKNIAIDWVKTGFITEVDRVLTDDGIYCFQGESIHFDKKEIKQFMNDLQKNFPICCYGNTTTPTYN
jgi:hypothetical protein